MSSCLIDDNQGLRDTPPDIFFAVVQFHRLECWLQQFELQPVGKSQNEELLIGCKMSAGSLSFKTLRTSWYSKTV